MRKSATMTKKKKEENLDQAERDFVARVNELVSDDLKKNIRWALQFVQPHPEVRVTVSHVGAGDANAF
jgi:lipopolysaccharide biosynthesis regulator YciM